MASAANFREGKNLRAKPTHVWRSRIGAKVFPLSRPLHAGGGATLLETAVVIEARKGEPGRRELDTLIRTADITIVPVEADQISEARRALDASAKAVNATGLNFGDVFAYALARTAGEPLLFKGEDFAKTDIARVI